MLYVHGNCCLAPILLEKKNGYRHKYQKEKKKTYAQKYENQWSLQEKRKKAHAHENAITFLHM